MAIIMYSEFTVEEVRFEKSESFWLMIWQSDDVASCFRKATIERAHGHPRIVEYKTHGHAELDFLRPNNDDCDGPSVESGNS